MMKQQLAGLMKQAQQMQENMKKMQEQLAGIEVEGQSGAGLVKAVITCRNEVKRVSIDPSLLGDDKDMLEDLVVAATARLADPPPVWRAVVFARSPADQAGLDREARAANLRESMVPSPGLGRRLEGRQVVIVDDVMTTGATLVEAARVLRECGAHPRAAVLAATQRQPVVRDREPD